MEQLFPSYYGDFQCIADCCPDSCCHEWIIDLDDQSAERFRSLPGPLGDLLRAQMEEEDGTVYLKNIDGRCPMWRSDGLCALQAEFGHDALCQICQQFPRFRQNFGDFVEVGIEMSCPEAARIMLTCDDWTLRRETIPGGGEPDYDPELMELLRQTRPKAFEILRDRSRPVPERLTLLLVYGHYVQALLDGEELPAFRPESALDWARRNAYKPDIGALADFYRGLEMLTDRWKTALDHLMAPRWDEMLCRFAQYGIYRYYYQCAKDWVYDPDAYDCDLDAWISLIVAGCVLCAHLPGDRMEAIQLYSKEIESSRENMEAILEAVCNITAMTHWNQMGLLGNF